MIRRWLRQSDRITIENECIPEQAENKRKPDRM
jgi:hypothetical protein